MKVNGPVNIDATKIDGLKPTDYFYPFGQALTISGGLPIDNSWTQNFPNRIFLNRYEFGTAD